MKSYLLPEQRRTIGVVLFVVGLLCLGMSGVMVSLISSARAETAAQFSQQQEGCATQLQGLGGEVEQIPGRIIWRKRGIEEGLVRMGEASVVAVLCPGWRMRTACIGSQCPESDAMRIVLEPMNEEYFEELRADM
tara:strand:+ start:6472 stop:6876 length:405 start_codon:yes stop_codon:yes gene_type:complete